MSSKVRTSRRRVKRERREVGNDVYFAAAARFIRAGGKRVAEGDIESLKDLVDLRVVLEAAERDAVAALRIGGYSLTEIARVLGVSRQYAWKRYGGTSNE